jgi:SAM-dependent methyltransferase
MRVGSTLQAKRLLDRASAAFPFLWHLVVQAYNLQSRLRSSAGTHPVDRHYGIDTGGAIPGWLLGNGSGSSVFSTAYLGCQPSCLRAALAAIEVDDLDATFIDLGCGKGRALFVATEFPFRAVMGVELSRMLAAVAQRNVERWRRRFPGRVVPSIVHADATQFSLPDGNLVVFLYHSFREPVLRTILERMEALRAEGREIVFIYENPVYGSLVDERPGFRRCFAEMVPADRDERPFHTKAGGRSQEAVIAWYAGDRRPPPPRTVDRRIVIEEEGWLASLL